MDKYNEQRKYQLALRRLYNTNTPSKQIIELIGTHKIGFINHIDKFLLDGMNITNFGTEWGFDHIVPLYLFDFNDETDLKLCYNYNNIMPIFNKDNRYKGASVHFSIEKLKSMYTIVSIDEHHVLDSLIKKCNDEINRIYQKYLISL